MKDIERIGKLIGLTICSLFILIPFPMVGLQWIVFGGILITVGIPHGAIDHMLTTKKRSLKNLLVFLFNYLILIALYFILWLFIPKLALVAFILMSSYHFGQSHFLTEDISFKSWPKFTLTGSYFLALILFSDFDETRKIIAPIVELTLGQESRNLILIILGISTLGIQIWSESKIKFQNTLEFILLSICLYYSPLLIGFIVYFGFWHALPSMQKEYTFLIHQSTIKGIPSFIYALLPFSLISLIGIGSILGLGLNFLESEKLILTFFILVSLISFPHIIYMDNFLRKSS